MTDERYLVKRYNTWFVRVPIPASLRGTKGYKSGAIFQTLGHGDLRKAQNDRWAIVDTIKDDLRIAMGELRLDTSKIQARAWRLYEQTKKELENRPPKAQPQGDETPHEAALLAHIGRYEDCLEQCDYEPVGNIIKRIAPKLPEGSPTWNELGEALVDARLTAFRGRLQSLRGELPEEPIGFGKKAVDTRTFKPVITIAPPIVPKALVLRNTKGPVLSEAIELFLAERQRDPGAALIKQSEHQYKGTFRLLQEFTDDAPVAAIDRKVANAFIAALGKLPATWGKSKAHRDMTFKEIIESTADTKRITNKTLNRHISAVSTLFKFIQRSDDFDYTEENPFSNQWRKEAKTNATRWLPFEIAEINRLFAGEPRTELRWLMLLALYTGGRINELAQLHKNDVRQEGGIWYINISNEHDGQHVKSEAGFRVVPVHSALIAAGFLDYHKQLKNGMLWPTIEPGGLDNKYGWNPSRWFTLHRRKVGVDRKRCVFHSFRKNAAQALKNKKATPSQIAELIGHEQGFTLSTYAAQGLPLPDLKELIERISYQGLKL
jgi:integrase